MKLLATLALAASLVAAMAVRADVVGERASGASITRGVGYANAIRLEHQRAASANGELLLVFEEDGLAGVPLYASGNDGLSWRLLRHVTDQPHAGDRTWHLRWQPDLVELDRAAGPLPAGTLLLAANATRSASAGPVVEERLQLYASADAGRTWRYLSDIAAGAGRPEDRDNGGVWEPNLRLLPDGRLVAFYSSEGHKAQGFNQLLAHKVSTDGGLTWGAQVVDLVRPGEVERPGMAVVQRAGAAGYVMSYEDIDGPRNGAVYLKHSADGLSWGDPTDRGVPVLTASGAWPAASPVVRWIDDGSSAGVLVVAAERGGAGGDPGGRSLYWNADGGRGPWWRMPAPVRKLTGNIHAGWTQALLPSRDGRALIHVTSSSTVSAPGDPAANELLTARSPLRFDRYEAEDAIRDGAVQIETPEASNMAKLRLAARGSARFPVVLRRAGSGTLVVRHADVNRPAPVQVRIDGGPTRLLRDSPESGSWKRALFTIGKLPPGPHEIIVSAPTHAVDLDWIALP